MRLTRQRPSTSCSSRFSAALASERIYNAFCTAISCYCCKKRRFAPKTSTRFIRTGGCEMTRQVNVETVLRRSIHGSNRFGVWKGELETPLQSANLLFGGCHWQHQMLILRARPHDIWLRCISHIGVSRITADFLDRGTDNHHVRAGLHPMLMRCALSGVVIAGAVVTGKHADKADLVWRVRFRD